MGGGPCSAGDDTAATWIWSGALADDGEDDALTARLEGLGFADPAAMLARLRAVWQSSRYTGLPEKSRQRFDSVAQRALEAAPKIDAARRDDTIVRLFDLLETVSRRGVYLALLTEYPAALPQWTRRGIADAPRPCDAARREARAAPPGGRRHEPV
ncbi:glutamate-ammonia-ligase adenylyltransferase [Burkholderia multivorans CGD2M]|nr:glutamate-ammonia-ligase adenylyltransferase [Burkholderia multivorans CGD2M]